MGDASGSRGASVEAKKLLREVGERVEGLEKGLVRVVGKTLGEGEKRRREEMLEGDKAERGNLQRMAEAGIRTSLIHQPTTSNPPTNGTMPGTYSTTTTPQAGRVFGSRKQPAETTTTRPLDDRGLVQLQQTQMGDQDQQLGELSKLLQRQKMMGEEIHREIGEQNDLLDEVEGGVDKVGGKLGRAKRQLNRLN